MDTRSRLRYTFTHHTYEHAGGSVFMFVSGGDLGWRWVARERAPPKAGAHFTPRTRSDTTLNFELKFARGHASHTPLAANSPYSLCLGVSRAWATRGASHHPYGSRYGAVHATAALIASGVARVRGGASAEPPGRTRATPPPCRPGWGRHIPAPRKHIALRREQTISTHHHQPHVYFCDTRYTHGQASLLF